MRKMRLIALLLALVTVAMAMTGCHGAVERHRFAVPEEFDTEQQYEITFWAKNDTNITQADIYRRAIEEFEALYPNITVNLRLYTDYNRIYNDVITNIATGTTPNVCITYPDHIETYMEGENLVVPLNDLFGDKKYGLGGSELRFEGPREGQLIEAFLDECAFGEEYYAFPFMRSTEACYVNKTYVEKLGYTLPETLTWAFIWEVSEAAMAKDAEGNYLVNGQKVLIPFIYKSSDNMMIQLLKQHDAGYSTPTGEVKLFNDTTKELLLEIAGHAESGAFSTFKISSYPANFLNAGQCIFAIDSTAGATWMGSDAPLSDISEDAIVPFELQVMTVPQVDPENPQMISQGPSVCLFNKEDPQEVLASWLFAQYLLTDGIQMAYARTEGYLPVTSCAMENPAYVDYVARAGEDNDEHYAVKITASQMLYHNIENTFVTPTFVGSVALRNAAGELIEDVVKATRRNKTVDEAYIDALYGNVASLYRLDSLSAENGGKAALGPMPQTSRVLLIALGGVWLLILGYLAATKIKSLKKSRDAS